MPRKYLGLEIGTDTVTAVVVESGFKGNRMTAAARADIPLNTEGAEGTEGIRDLAAALEAIMADVDISRLACAVSLPPELISYRNLSVPFKGRKKINQILPFELESTLPFPAEELLIDFSIINRPDNPDQTDILTAAVEKTRVEAYLDILASFDIKPQVVTAGGYATALGLIQPTEIPEEWLFVRLDGGYCTLITGRAKSIDLMRSFRIPSTSPRKTHILAANIQQTLTAHEEVFQQDFTPERIWVSGYGREALELDKALEIPPDTSVEPVDFLSASGLFPGKPPKIPWRPDLMNNALALATMGLQGMKGINFYQGAVIRDTFFSKYKSRLIASGVLAAAALLIFAGGVFLEIALLEKKLSQLQGRIESIFKDTFPEVRKVVDPLQQMRVKMGELKKNASLSGENDVQIRVIDILNEISKGLPKRIDVKFKRLVISADDLLIDGETVDFNQVDDVKGRLEGLEAFSKVTITAANMDRSGDFVRFKLKIQLKDAAS